jgi:hypothetical protein
MITTNTNGLYKTLFPGCRKDTAQSPQKLGQCLQAQVSLLTLMVGNLDEKSLALAAILTATWRATAL